MEYTAKVTFGIRYVVTDEEQGDILAEAIEENKTILRAAKDHLENLLNGWAYPDNDFIGRPGQSLEAVLLENNGKVREFSVVPQREERF